MSKRFHVDPNERVDVYEFDPDEVVSDTAPNIITIRARMNVEIAGRVSSELMKLDANNKPELHVGANVGALLLHNILSWRGPDFDELPCTPANIRALPTGDPFIEKVADAISERNKAKESPNPKLPATDNTSASAGANGYPELTRQAAAQAGLSLQLATGTQRSSLLRAMDGRQNRSDD